MIKSPRYLNAKQSLRPYRDVFNTESVYHSGSNKVSHDELTDAEIDALINSDSDTLGIKASDFDIKPNLFGDDYADAILADM